VLASSLIAATVARAQEVLFEERFEGDLTTWDVSNPNSIRRVDSGDPQRGNVLEMTPHDLAMRALVRGSEEWGAYRVEGMVRFPSDEQNYLGFLYHYTVHDDTVHDDTVHDDTVHIDIGRADRRIDTGSLYIKGNGSYVQMNPRRDWNPGRALYPELRVPLEGESAITIGEWQRFALEVVGRDCHLYLGSFDEPAITTDLFEGERGAFGLKPRVAGGPVWVDDLRVTRIERATWQGPRRPPAPSYQPDRLVTEWLALGPLLATSAAVEGAVNATAVVVHEHGGPARFAPFETDARGAVVTARLVDFRGPATVAYFATMVEVDVPSRFALSSIDDFAVWVDGEFRGYGYAGRFAWHDFAWNDEHGTSGSVELTPGRHVILIRVRGGRYASGGFFAALLPAAP